jgi:hypothetical protein
MGTYNLHFGSVNMLKLMNYCNFCWMAFNHKFTCKFYGKKLGMKGIKNVTLRIWTCNCWKIQRLLLNNDSIINEKYSQIQQF